MTSRRALLIVAGVVLAGIVYSAFIYHSAEDRVQRICTQIQPGMTLDALQAFAEQNGMRKPTRADGVDFVVETKTFGRYGCAVTLQSGVVQKSEYRFTD